MRSESYKGTRFLRVRIIRKRIGSSYWFRPFILIFLGIIVSRLLLLTDQLVHDLGYDEQGFWWIFKVVPIDAARDTLVSQATVLLGLFGVLLSLALIPLTIATSSYGNIILNNFLRDKGTQNVIGFFAFVIFFDLSAAIAIPTLVTWDNYPGITLTVSLAFVAGALIASIYFFNHVAHLLQATYVSKAVTDELMEEIEISQIEYSTHYSQDQVLEFGKTRAEIAEGGDLVRATRYGYVAGLNYHRIVKKADRVGAVILILKLPGDYVASDEPVAKFLIEDRSDARGLSKVVNSSYTLGVNRTVMQDIDYGVQQLAIIASRALSPAVNDPNTAMICIDKIGQVLSLAASKPARSPYMQGRKGELRLIADPDDFERLMATGFNQIRQYGNKAYEVMSQALYAIETIAYSAQRSADLEVIRRHADLILEDSLGNLTSEWSKGQVRSAYGSAINVVERRIKEIQGLISQGKSDKAIR